MKSYAWSNRHSEARARGWVGAGSASSGVDSPAQLLPDEDANFTTTIGNWTHSAGTLTRDTGHALDTLSASAKFTPASAGDHIDLPISGTFKAGVPYVVVLVLRPSTSATATRAQFGLIGTDAVQWGDFTLLAGNWAISLRWTPSADRTGVSVRLSVLASADITNLMAARLYQAPEPPVVQIGVDLFAPLPISTVAKAMLGPRNNLQFYPTGSVWNADAYSGAGVQLSDFGDGTADEVYVWGEHTPGDFAAEGFNVEVGADYVGLFISEKDAGTVQIYADFSSGYDIELKDRGTTHFKMVTAAGVAAIPSMGMLPQYSAAPHAGTETEGESYYDTTLHKARTWASGAWHDWW